MQQVASSQLNLKPDACMKAAQALYEQGHITYHRTDNPNITEADFALIRLEAERHGFTVVNKMRMFAVKDGAQVGHPSITPTHWDKDIAGETAEQQALYKLIRTTAMASQMQDARFAVRVVELQGENSLGRVHKFEARGKVLTDAGWTKFIKNNEEDEGAQEDDSGENPVPELEIGQQLAASDGRLILSETRPPKRYTQASLIKKLEGEGIGRPSTYSAIMNTIIEREYVIEQAKSLVPTEKGINLVELMAGRFSFMELSFTREIEGLLDLMAQGQQNYRTVVGEFHSRLVREIASLVESMPRRPTDKMLLAVKAIAQRKSLNLSAEALESFDVCQAFLNEHSDNAGNARPASDKQLITIRKLFENGHILVPEGYPLTLTAAAASQAIEAGMKASKKRKPK